MHLPVGSLVIKVSTEMMLSIKSLKCCKVSRASLTSSHFGEPESQTLLTCHGCTAGKKQRCQKPNYIFFFLKWEQLQWSKLRSGTTRPQTIREGQYNEEIFFSTMFCLWGCPLTGIKLLLFKCLFTHLHHPFFRTSTKTRRYLRRLTFLCVTNAHS